MKNRALLLFLLFAIPSIKIQAANLRSGKNIQITEAISDDLYLTADKITITAPVKGDVTAAGSSINISDTVLGDVLLTGGEIQLLSFVQDDIRAIGGTLNIRQGCGGDLLLFGGTVIIHEDAHIIGDVILFGGELVINGTIDGNVKCYGGSITMNGTMGKDIFIKGGTLFLNGPVSGNAVLAGSELSLGPKVLFNEKVNYWTPNGEISFEGHAKNAVYDADLGKSFEENEWSVGSIFSFLIFGLFTSLLVAILLIFLLGRYFARGAHRFENDFFKSFGFGVIYVIGIPVVIAILILTLIGIPLGLLLLSIFLFTLLFAPTFSAVLLTYWLKYHYGKHWNKWIILLISGAIFLGIWLLLMVPIIGWLTGIVVIGASLGAILLGIGQKRISTAVL